MTTLSLGRADLDAAVRFAAKALPRNAPHPALNGLRITSAGGQVIVSAFDYDTYAEARAGGSSEPADFLLSGRAFSSYLAGMTASSVTFDVGERQADIVCGSARVTLPLLSLADYPSAPPVPTSVGTVDAGAFAQGFAHVAESVDPNDAVVQMRGVIAEIAPGLLRIAGGSRYVYAKRDVDSWDGDGEQQVLMPVKIGEALKSLTGPVVVGADDSRLSLATDTHCVVARLLEGQPPPYQRMFDSHTALTTAVVDRDELVGALKWVTSGDIRKDTFGHIVLTANTDGLTVALRVIDGPSASTEVEAKVDGDEIRTGWKTTYLLSGLGGTAAGTVTLGFGGERKAMRLSAESDPSFSALVMPVKLP